MRVNVGHVAAERVDAAESHGARRRPLPQTVGVEQRRVDTKVVADAADRVLYVLTPGDQHDVETFAKKGYCRGSFRGGIPGNGHNSNNNNTFVHTILNDDAADRMLYVLPPGDQHQHRQEISANSLLHNSF